MKTLIFMSVLLGMSTSFASDHWESCSDAFGNIKLEGGDLIVDGQSIKPDSVKTVLNFPKVSEKCFLKNSKPKQEVVAFENTDSVVEVKYKYLNTKAVHTAKLICSIGGSGLPASAECEEN